MTVLYLMCGAPGSGKSTWIEKHKVDTDVVISRDAIRNSLVKDCDDFFSKEKLVFNTFVNQINEAINRNALTIYADATHLNEISRNKLLDKLHLSDEVQVIPVFIKQPLSVCLQRNQLRKGRANVPSSAITRMYYNLEEPTHNERHHYANIIITE